MSNNRYFQQGGCKLFTFLHSYICSLIVVIMSTGGEKSKPASQPDGKAAQTQKRTEMGVGNYKVCTIPYLQMH